MDEGCHHHQSLDEKSSMLFTESFGIHLCILWFLISSHLVFEENQSLLGMTAVEAEYGDTH